MSTSSKLGLVPDGRNSAPPSSARSRGRQPLLWAALALAAGIVLGVQAWRPPAWWVIAIGVACACGAFLMRRRAHWAWALALGAFFAYGALLIQLHAASAGSGDGLAPFTDGELVSIIAHVTREGVWRASGPGERRVTIDLETEEASNTLTAQVRSGLRLTIYDKLPPGSSLAQLATPYDYGQRLHLNCKLRSPRNFRNPGAFDYRGYLSDLGITALGSTKISDVELLPGFAGDRWRAWRARAHRSIIQQIHATWPEPQAALVDAMVVGEAAFIEHETRDNFQRSGTYHILVVSGMNVGILACVVMWVLRRFRTGDAVASVITVLASIAYAILTDVGPPVWRATLMMAIYLGARLLYRERAMLNAIGAAALGLLMVNPEALFGASFLLTFLCVLLIAALGVPLLERTATPVIRGTQFINSKSFDWHLPPRVVQFRLDLRLIAERLGRFIGKRLPLPALALSARAVLGGFELLVISAIMQVGLTLPMAYYFHRATSVSVLANMLVVPLTGLLMPASIAAVAASYAASSLARLPAWVAAIALDGISGSVSWLGAVNQSNLRVPTPEPLMVVLVACSILAAILLVNRHKFLVALGLGAMATAALALVMIPPRPHLRPGVFEVTSIDVGQGDSTLLVSPTGHLVLVDSGGIPHWMHSEFDIGEQVVSPYLWNRGISRLDVIAVSHAHADHLGGMRAILANFRPRELWLGDGPTNGELEKLLTQARAAGMRIVRFHAGDEFDYGGLKFRVLAPALDPITSAGSSNDDSLVMTVGYKNTAALLEGDAEKLAENRITSEHPAAQLLKVAHHGSANSTSSAMLAAVHPKFAAISVGVKNPYGHPRIEVLERLAAAGVATYRTDIDGAVTFYLDGSDVIPRPQNLP